MYFKLMGKLSARRKAILEEEKEQGFTLIELLVVVVIIGILAAIAIPIYIGVQNGAKDASVQSDLVNTKTALVAVYSADSTVAEPADGAPTTASGITGKTLANFGATDGGNMTAAIAFGGTHTWPDFCIEATSKSTGAEFHADASGGVAKGLCS